MDRVEESAKAAYVHPAMPDVVLEEEKEEEKPKVTSRAEDDVPMSTQAVEEMSDEEPQVAAMPVLHGNGAIHHNAAVQEATETTPMLVDKEPVDASMNESAWSAARWDIVELLHRWAEGEASAKSGEEEFKRASEMAAQGDPVAMYQLSLMMVGDAFNTPAAQQKRFELLVDSANKGWVPAYEALAGYYQFAVQDMIAAAKCYGAIEAYWPFFQHQAVQEGWLPCGQQMLKVSDSDVIGVVWEESPASNVHAFIWQVRMAREGSPAAMRKVAAKLLAPLVEEARAKRAYTWLDSAAAAGDTKAMLALGMMFEHGVGVTQDRARALALYKQAAEKGLVDAQMKLSSLCAQYQNSSKWRAAGLITDGKGMGAYEWCLRAAKQGSLQAKLQMAQMLATGDGVARDVKAAFALCKEAADAGLDEAYLPLALMYVTGTGTERDEDEAMYYLDERDSDPKGAYILASIHMGNDDYIADTASHFGIHVSVNKKRAFAWFREAGWEMLGNDANEKVKELVAAGDGAFIDENEAREWDRYEEWPDDWSEITFPSEDTLDTEEVRQLVEQSIRTGTWKPSGGECIYVASRSGYHGAIDWIKYLPQALSEAPRLRHLNLEDNHLTTDDRADHIATLIRETKTLEVLKLGGNRFTASGYRTIAGAMQDNFTLRRVHINARFNSEESRLIRSLCLRNRKLQELFADFKWPSPLTFKEVATEISELLEHHLIAEDQKDGSQSASATRQRVLEMLMCLEPKVLQPKVLRTTADPRTT